MESINKLKGSIQFLQTEINKLESSLLVDPTNFAFKLQVNNDKSEVQNLQKELYNFNLRRRKEIIALRLKGPVARKGSFPLELVGGITNTFSEALYKTSQYIQYGKKGGKRIEQLLKRSLDIRLEAVGAGSTIFYVSAKTSPDLFGNSVIQNSLENTFDLFSSKNEKELIDNMEKVGVKSSKHFSKFLGELVKDNLELEIKWESPDYEVKTWFGDRDTIRMFHDTFNHIETSKPENFEFLAEFITLSLKNRIEVRDLEENRIYSVKYPTSFMNAIKGFHVGDTHKIIVGKTIILNTLTKDEKFEYNLIKI